VTVTELHVHVAGRDDASTVVLVHGSMDRSTGLARLSRRLEDEYRVVRYDRRGYGRSRDVGAPFTVEAHIDDLCQVIATWGGPGMVDIIGHSFGGNVALGAAQRLGANRVRTVMVYEPPLSWTPEWPGGSAHLTADDPEASAEAFMRRLIGDARWERLPSRTRAERIAEGPVLVEELSNLRTGAPWQADAIDVPVLTVAGSRGRDHHRAGVRTIAGWIRGAETTEVDGAHHFGPNSHPSEVAALWRDFVARRG